MLIETSDLADIDGTVVKQEAVRRLHANRPLCEDYEEIEILENEDVILNARIAIGPVDDAEAVLANIYEEISNYFSPRVPFATVDEMREAGLPADRIFDGPPLEHGFVRFRSTAADAKTDIYLYLGSDSRHHGSRRCPGCQRYQHVDGTSERCLVNENNGLPRSGTQSGSVKYQTGKRSAGCDGGSMQKPERSTLTA